LQIQIHGLLRILKYILVAFFAFSAIAGYSQKRGIKQKNLQGFDERRYHFGFTLGVNSASSYLDRNFDTAFGDSLLNMYPGSAAGFNLGIVTQLKLLNNFSMRFVPMLSFQDRIVNYEFQDGPRLDTYVKRVESTFIDFPINFKYRSNRINNFAVYVLFGGKYSLDVASQKDVRNVLLDELIIKLRQHDYSAEVGGGFDFFLPYFKFGIELKLSVGIPNLIIDDNTIFSDPIQSLRTRTFMVSFTFEG
jgi:hypothetical protein